MEMEMAKKKYICIYMLKGMFRTTIGADTIQQLYELLEMKEVVSGAIDDLTDLEILEKIYADSLSTTGRLTVYKLMRRSILKRQMNLMTNILSVRMVSYRDSRFCTN